MTRRVIEREFYIDGERQMVWGPGEPPHVADPDDPDLVALREKMAPRPADPTEIASRKVMISPELMEQWRHFRRDDGRPMRMDWGEPDEDGWYSPVATVEECDHEFLREGDYCAICGTGL